MARRRSVGFRHMADVLEMPPRGHYLAHEVGRLVGVSGQRIAQWAIRGYIPASQSRSGHRVYAYQDIAEAMIVHELLERDMAPRTIREAVAIMRSDLGTRWPLQQVRLQIPPDHPQAKGKKKTIVATYKNQQTDVSRRMLVLEDVDLEEVGRYLQRGGWAAREIPNLRNIEVDPDRLSGRPAIRGTRVPADTAGPLAQTAEGRAILKADYDLTMAQIEDARRWWEKVAEYAA